MMSSARRGWWPVVFVAVVASCKKAPEPEPAVAPSAAPVPSVQVLRPEDLPEDQRVPTAWPIPSGPRLAILPGQGLGPIRLGATIATIERLMGTECEIKTEDTCRYIGRAAEFFLKDGVTVEIRTHRPDRPTTPKPRVMGVFNGRMQEGVAFLMLQPSVRDLIGPPLKVEPVADGGDAHTVEVWTYDGMRIEFDKLPNGNVVVGGITIVKADKPFQKKVPPGPPGNAKKK